MEVLTFMTKKRRCLLAITSLFLAFTLFYISIPHNNVAVNAAYIDPATDATVQSLENKINNVEKKLSNLQYSINNTKNSITKEQANKDYIDECLALVGEDIELSKQLIEAYDNAIVAKQAEIAQREADIREKYELFGEWIKAFYVNGDVSYLQMLFGTDDIKDMLSTTEYIAEIMEANNEMMDRLEEEVVELRREKGRLDIYRSEQVATRTSLEAQEANYAELARQSANYLNELRSDRQAYEAEYKRMLAEEEKLNKQLEEELERIAKQNAVYVGGDLIWPCELKFKRISSYYGYRDIGYGQEWHSGIDIPANYGSNIYAANAGKVIKATKHSSYGYYVLIDHGGGRATLYAHNSKLLVTEGQTVTQGQVIALAGSTGRSTGNHCHFEVRINGKQVNPLDYISAPK